MNARNKTSNDNEQKDAIEPKATNDLGASSTTNLFDLRTSLPKPESLANR